MNIAEIKSYDIANGPGVRVSVFVSGCTRHCPGCFNEVAWDFDYGVPYDDKVEQSILDLLDNPHVAGLSILGGEPFEPQNQPYVRRLVERVREKYPNKNIWCYTGFTYDDLCTNELANPDSNYILEHIDVLVEGPFIQEQKNLMLAHRGSENQRILDMDKINRTGLIALWEDAYE